MRTTWKVLVQLAYTWCGNGRSSSSSKEQQWRRHRLSWRELSATKRHHARSSSADNWLTYWYVTAIYTQMPSQSISLVAPQTTFPSFPHHPPPLCRRPGYLSRRIRYPLHRPTCIDTPPTRPPAPVRTPAVPWLPRRGPAADRRHRINFAGLRCHDRPRRTPAGRQAAEATSEAAVMAQRRRGRHLHIDLVGACLRAASTTYSLELDADTGSLQLAARQHCSVIGASTHSKHHITLCEPSPASPSSNAYKSCETTQQHQN